MRTCGERVLGYGIKVWNRIGKSTKGTGGSQNVESEEKCGRFAKVSQTTKPYGEDVLVMLINKVIEWSLSLKR